MTFLATVEMGDPELCVNQNMSPPAGRGLQAGHPPRAARVQASALHTAPHPSAAERGSSHLRRVGDLGTTGEREGSIWVCD